MLADHDDGAGNSSGGIVSRPTFEGALRVHVVYIAESPRKVFFNSLFGRSRHRCTSLLVDHATGNARRLPHHDLVKVVGDGSTYNSPGDLSFGGRDGLHSEANMSYHVGYRSSRIGPTVDASDGNGGSDACRQLDVGQPIQLW
jgi:hypothetical protein